MEQGRLSRGRRSGSAADARVFNPTREASGVELGDLEAVPTTPTDCIEHRCLKVADDKSFVGRARRGSIMNRVIALLDANILTADFRLESSPLRALLDLKGRSASSSSTRPQWRYRQSGMSLGPMSLRTTNQVTQARSSSQRRSASSAVSMCHGRRIACSASSRTFFCASFVTALRTSVNTASSAPTRPSNLVGRAARVAALPGPGVERLDLLGQVGDRCREHAEAGVVSAHAGATDYLTGRTAIAP